MSPPAPKGVVMCKGVNIQMYDEKSISSNALNDIKMNKSEMENAKSELLPL